MAGRLKLNRVGNLSNFTTASPILPAGSLCSGSILPSAMNFLIYCGGSGSAASLQKKMLFTEKALQPGGF